MCKNFTTWLNKQLYSNDGQFESFHNHAAKLQKLQQNGQHLNNYHKHLHNNYMPRGKAHSELRLCSHFDGK